MKKLLALLALVFVINTGQSQEIKMQCIMAEMYDTMFPTLGKDMYFPIFKKGKITNKKKILKVTSFYVLDGEMLTYHTQEYKDKPELMPNGRLVAIYFTNNKTGKEYKVNGTLTSLEWRKRNGHIKDYKLVYDKENDELSFKEF
jgi:hypothetical protein